MVARGYLARADRVRRETVSLIWLFTIVTGTSVLLWEASFLRLWVGERYYPGPAAILMVMVMVMQFALIRTDANIIDLTLDLRRKVLIGALAAVVSVALAWLFVGPMDLGIVGLAFGFVLGRTIQSISYPWMIAKLLGIAPRRQFAGIVRPALTTAILLGVAAWLGSVVRVDTWLALVLVVGISAASVTGVAFFAGMGAENRTMVWRRLIRVVRMA
jgi:O-antigen/teichoic acid export membrane protein